VSHHAKAPSAGSTEGSGKGRGRFRRAPLASLAALLLLASLALGVALSSAAVPVVTIEPASEVGFTTAKAEGKVDPGEKETLCHFEYISSAQFDENEGNAQPGFTNAAQAACDVEPLTGNTAQTVTADLGGLVAGTTYHLRLVASNEDGTEAEVAPNFITQSATAPTLALGSPGAVTYTKAHISGTVDPEGGNVNPLGGVPVPITWQLQISRDPVNEGWGTAAEGTIEGPEAEASAPIAVPAGGLDLENLQNGANYKFRLKAFYAGKESTKAGGEFTTLAVSPPGVTVEDASLVTGTTAHFKGAVTPGGADAAFNSNCTFDYVTDKQFLIDEFASAQPIGCNPNPVEGAGSSTVVADPTGLEPHTVYHLRLRAENLGGTTTATALDTFETEAIGPAITGSNASNVLTTSATLNAQVNPGGAATTYHFEYLTLADFLANGETFAGAKSTPESASIGADNLSHPVSANVTGLQLGAAYRFRVVATNSESPLGGTPGPATSFNTVGASVTQNCANEQLRAENNSLNLPDCRAYELVSPDSNSAALWMELGGAATADGETMMYVTIDAPGDASSGLPTHNEVRATRDALKGWTGVSLAPPVVAPVTGYFSIFGLGVSDDLSATAISTTQPLSGGVTSNGLNLFIGNGDGTYSLLTPIPTPLRGAFFGGTADFSHVFFRPTVAQLPLEDPLAGANIYSWAREGGLRLVGILPNGMPAPNGVSLPGGILRPFSRDASRVIFLADEKLYLRTDESHTVEIGGPLTRVEDGSAPSDGAGITADGKMVLFTSAAELTPDANTGSGTDRNLYSYDTVTGELTDLTVDTDPADVATGANVQRVLGATPDGSHIYFTATGHLANGATPGHTSLYVWHNGEIGFVADGAVSQLYVTPDGQNVAFASTNSLTGYDNTDPITGQPHVEVFKATLGAGIECVSCRANGTRPTADTGVPPQYLYSNTRIISNDGSRVFFASADAVVPQASNGHSHIFEYANGKVSLISPAGSSSNTELLATSASGDDVFFSTWDEIVPSPNSGPSAVYDARVGGGFPVNSHQRCSGVACRELQPPAPGFDQPGSRALVAGDPRSGSKNCKKGQVGKHGKCVKKSAHKRHGKKKQKRRGDHRSADAK
jgi:hypothetical protein